MAENVGHVLKWGIVGSGHICHAFCLSLLRLASPRHCLTAVASRMSRDRAQQFAEKFKMPKWYGSYEELFADPEINCIYIGNLTSDHFEAAMLSIKAGKATLVEKPMTMTPDETRQLIEASRQHKVLLMEAMWSRFMPTFERIRQLLAEGNKPTAMMANFVVPINGIDRIDKPEMGGGVLRDIGLYAIQLATTLWGGQAPSRISATGHANEHGVDVADSVSLLYQNGGIASILVDSRAGHRNLTEARIFFAPGSQYSSVRICPPFYVPTRLELFRAADGQTVTEDYPIYPQLGPPPEGLSFRNPASQALAYEAEAFGEIFQQWSVCRDVIEHPLRNHTETLIDAEVIAQATGQWLVAK